MDLLYDEPFLKGWVSPIFNAFACETSEKSLASFWREIWREIKFSKICSVERQFHVDVWETFGFVVRQQLMTKVVKMNLTSFSFQYVDVNQP